MSDILIGYLSTFMREGSNQTHQVGLPADLGPVSVADFNVRLILNPIRKNLDCRVQDQ